MEILVHCPYNCAVRLPKSFSAVLRTPTTLSFYPRLLTALRQTMKGITAPGPPMTIAIICSMRLCALVRIGISCIFAPRVLSLPLPPPAPRPERATISPLSFFLSYKSTSLCLPFCRCVGLYNSRHILTVHFYVVIPQPYLS